MKPILFLDVETTGLPLWREPSSDPRQPHLVQVAALLVDPQTRQVMHELDHIVRPDGWEIPDDVVAIHGITAQRATDVGIPEEEALGALLGLHALCEFRVAHNESFDARMVRIAIKRYIGDVFADQWKEAPAECTAKMTRPLVHLPRNKMPTLGEAYQALFGEELRNAHSALADVQACARVYFEIQDRAARAPAAA